MTSKSSSRLFSLFMVALSAVDRVNAQSTIRNATLYQLISTGQATVEGSCSSYQQCDSIFNDVTPCYCDEYCHAMKDCCYSWYQNPTSNKTPLKGLVKCYDKTESKTTSAVLLISDCPDDYDDDVIRHNCKHHAELSVIEKSPVASSSTFLSYRNKYCALCNSVHEGDFDIWKFHFECETYSKPRNMSFTALIQSFVDDEGCEFLYKPSNDRYFRECSPSTSMLYQSCPASYGGHLREVCDGYRSMLTIYVNDKAFRDYKNVHCLECDVKEIAIPDNALLYVYCFKRGTNQRQSLSVTLDFTKFLFGSNSKDEEKGCSEKDVKVDETERCVALFCPDEQVPYFGDCVTDVVKTRHVLAFDVLFVINNTVEPEQLQKELPSLVKRIARKCFGRLTSTKKGFQFQLFSGVNPISRKGCHYVKVYFQIASPLFELDADCPKSRLDELHYTMSMNTVMTSIEQVQKDVCFIPQTLETPNLVVHAISLSQSKVGVACPSIQVQVLHIQNETDQIKQMIYKIGSKQIDRDDVNATDRGFFICIDLFKSKYINISGLSINGSSSDVVGYGLIITYTGFSLSVVSMLVTLVHYICIPNVTTRNNSVIVHLLSLTLLTHIVYLTTYFDILCWWAAILLHFLFLVMFFTMSLTLLHIAIHLCKSENPSYRQNTVKMITRFILPGYTLPLIIVVITVTGNMLMYKDRDWYGADTKICFLSDAMALFLFFAIPVLICLVSNIITFSVTCKRICSSKISNANMNIHYDRFWILVKLSSLVGFSWILGFVGVLTGNQILLYAFEGTSSLQGVFLSGSLLYNHKVKQWYRSCFGSTTRNTDIELT